MSNFRLPYTTIEEQDFYEKESNNVVDLKLVSGGKEPPADGNWLRELEDGTIFLIEDKNSHDFNLGQVRLLHKEEKSIYLGFIVNGNPITSFVNPIKFCQRYRLYETLGVVKDMPKETIESLGIPIEEDTIDIPKEETNTNTSNPIKKRKKDIPKDN